MLDDRLEEIFHELLELSPEHAEERLRALGREDEALGRELASLLRAFGAAPRFLTPAFLAAGASPELDPTRETAPRQLGKYAIREEIGRGAAGIVYLAVDPDLNRPVAIKTLATLPPAALRHRRAAKLREEARALASVVHPNVAQVHSIEEVATPEGGSIAILTMEYVPGMTLAEQLRSGPLAMAPALDYGRQIAAALEAAHQQSVVHRDLKPQNIRISPEGWVKVLDFGLATLARSRSAPEPERSPAGTPGYMSPEQCRGEQVDPPSDLWSLGCVLYECLAGKPAVAGDTLTAVFDANRRGEVDLGSVPGGVPERVRGLLRRCVDRDAGRRPPATLARQILEEELLRLRANAFLSVPAAVPASAAEQIPEEPRGFLPRPLSSFVGREALLELLHETRRANRLLTLIGPGGVGKTRAALQVAGQWEGEFDGGIWFVDLAALAHGSEVPAAVARALRLREERIEDGDGPAHLRSIAAALRGRSSLLILDNCEHVLEPVARFAEMILARAPATAILATSRQPLGISGEQVIPVPPLALPEEADTPEAAAKTEAVVLFLRRARARLPGFAPDASAIRTILAICRRLDGLPLAIELAASHARSLSADLILERIVAGRSLPHPGSAAPERHRSLANLVDWSYRLLTPGEQALLRRLSIFRGGSTLAAAEAVCGGWGGIERWQVCDLAARLVERSLVEPDFRGSEGLPAARYRLLDTIRVFSAQRLAEEESEAANVESRYLEHLAALAAPRAEEKGPTRTAWVQRVEPEYANLVHAMDLALERGRTDIAFGLGEMIAYLWVQTGQWIEGVDGDLDTAEASVLESRACFLKAEDWGGAAVCIGNLGIVESSRGNHEAALGHYREYLRLSREMGDPLAEAKALGNIGWTAMAQGSTDEARSLLEQALAIHESNRDFPGASMAHLHLGDMAIAAGDFAAARSHLRATLRMRRGHGDRGGLLPTLVSFSRLAEKEGDDLRAAEIVIGLLHVHHSGELRFRPETVQMLGDRQEALAQKLGAEPITRAVHAGERRDLFDLVSLADSPAAHSGVAAVRP